METSGSRWPDPGAPDLKKGSLTKCDLLIIPTKRLKECIANDKLATITMLRPVAGWPVTEQLYLGAPRHLSHVLGSHERDCKTAQTKSNTIEYKDTSPLGDDGIWSLQPLGYLVMASAAKWWENLGLNSLNQL
jgi:hypothetical protein